MTRCLSKGSVMRLETRDGMPVDITPILHAFVGERTRDGYGEIASYPDALVFEPYVLEGGYPVFEGCDALRGVSPQECHLFDDSKELRIVYRESTGERLEMLLTLEEERAMDPDLLFEEDVLVKPHYRSSGKLPAKLKITNRYRYSEHDTLTLDTYRISAETSQQ